MLVVVVISVTSAIMVVIIPVTIRMPTTAVFVPPLVGVRPAILARLAQLVARVIRLSAFPSVVFGSFVQAMIGFCDALLTGSIIGANRRCTHEQNNTCQGRCRKPHPCPI